MRQCSYLRSTNVVSVAQRAVNNKGNDLDITAMRVCAEHSLGLDEVVIHNTHVGESVAVVVLILSEGEVEARQQPVVVSPVLTLRGVLAWIRAVPEH